jgi:FimV-like protein
VSDFSIRRREFPAVPKHDELHLNLARLYVQMGDREKARAVTNRLLAKKPGDAVALRALREPEPR